MSTTGAAMKFWWYTISHLGQHNRGQSPWHNGIEAHKSIWINMPRGVCVHCISARTNKRTNKPINVIMMAAQVLWETRTRYSTTKHLHTQTDISPRNSSTFPVHSNWNAELLKPQQINTDRLLLSVHASVVVVGYLDISVGINKKDKHKEGCRHWCGYWKRIWQGGTLLTQSAQ